MLPDTIENSLELDGEMARTIRNYLKIDVSSLAAAMGYKSIDIIYFELGKLEFDGRYEYFYYKYWKSLYKLSQLNAERFKKVMYKYMSDDRVNQFEFLNI